MFVGELDVVLLFVLEALSIGLGWWVEEGMGMEGEEVGLDNVGCVGVLVVLIIGKVLLLGFLGGGRHRIVLKIITENNYISLL